jgi:hypothetical protein
LLVGHARQAGQDVLEIGKRFHAAAAAAFDNRVEDGSAISSVGLTNKEPILFSQGGGTDRVLYAEMPIMRIRLRGGVTGRMKTSQGWAVQNQPL